MAGLVIQRCHDRFPPGTVIAARPAAKVAPSGHFKNKAPGSAVQATVASAVPHLTFAGLDPSTPHVLTAVVGGELRRLYATSEAI